MDNDVDADDFHTNEDDDDTIKYKPFIMGNNTIYCNHKIAVTLSTPET